MHLKLLQKNQFKKKAETTGDLIGNKITEWMFQKNYNKITQRQLQTRIIKRKPKERYIFPEKYKKILMILDLYNSIIMEYQKMLGNTRNQPTKFRTKNWVEINDEH